MSLRLHFRSPSTGEYMSLDPGDCLVSEDGFHRVVNRGGTYVAEFNVTTTAKLSWCVVGHFDDFHEAWRAADEAATETIKEML